MKKALKNYSLVIEKEQSSSNYIVPMNKEHSSSSQSDSVSDQIVIYDDTSTDEEFICSSDEDD